MTILQLITPFNTRFLKLVYCSLFFFILIHVTAFSQDDVVEDMVSESPTPFTRSFKIGAGFPFITDKGEFNSVFRGTYYFSGSFDLKVFKTILVGCYADYSQFDSGNPRILTDVIRNHITNAGLRFGYEKLVNKFSFYSLSVDGGYSGIDYKLSHPFSDTITHLKNFNTLGSGFSFSYGIIIEGKKAIVFSTKYHFINDKFNPADVKRAGNVSNKNSQYLTISILFALGL